MAAFVVLCIFFTYSVAYNIFGVLANNIMQSCNISLSSAGVMTSMFQIGALGGIALSPLALKKLSNESRLRLGMILDMIGLLMIFFLRGGTPVFVLFMFMGMGGFFIDSGANGYLAGAYPSKRARLIPLLHFSYSVGALLCGYLVLPFKSNEKWFLGYGIAGLVMLALFVIGFFVKGKAETDEDGTVKKTPETVPVKTILKDKTFLMYCVVLMLYMSSQQTCTSWLPLFIETDFHASNAVVAATTMSFWIGIAAMRLLASIILKSGKLDPLTTTVYGMMLSFAAMLGIVFAPSAPIALVCAAVCGFGSGALIPLFIVEVSGWYPGNTGFISTFYLICGTTGRMIFPYLVAFFGDRYGMRIALGASSALLLGGLILAVMVRNRRKSAAAV